MKKVRKKVSGPKSSYDLYYPTTEIQTQAEADKYLNKLVSRRLRLTKSKDRLAALVAERENIGYFAGYYTDEVRERVERLFNCVHPYFGSIAVHGPPSLEKAFALGKQLGKELKKDGTRRKKPVTRYPQPTSECK